MSKNTYNDMAKQPPAFFLKVHTCVNLLDDDIIARNETKVNVYFLIIIIRFCLSTVSFRAIDLISSATAIILSIKTNT